MLIMTENDVNPLINNDPMEKKTNLSITPRICVFEMRFDLCTLDSGEQSLPFGLLVIKTDNPRKSNTYICI